MSTIRSRLALLVLAIFVVASCSSAEPIQPEPTPGPESAQEGSDNIDPESRESETGDAQTSASGDPNPTDTDPADTDQVGTDPTDTDAATSRSEAVPTLADADLAAIENLQAGEQVEDAQGNVIAVYGVAPWPETFAAMPVGSRSQLPFTNNLAALSDPSTTLMALDVGVCTAGIDAVGSGTAEFFVHDDATEPLAGPDSAAGDAGVLFMNYPVANPGFGFPAPAECSRGWLPVIRSVPELPTTARYVLATRSPNGTEVDRYVYQWEIGATEIDRSSGIEDSDVFQAGQTVTFNEGALTDTTVRIDGWAELIGAPSVEGSRQVAVSISYCSSSTSPPNWGLAVDGWNIVAPIVADELLASVDRGSDCAEGWLQFMVPHGGVPTAFFASDGSDPVNGYAEWSLENAALAAPQ